MANDMFVHFLQRAKERYGLDLTLEDLQYMAEQIKSGRAKLTKITSHSFQYKVRCKKQQLVVILNRNHSYFITVLPLNKYTEKSTFNGKSYHYEDALYVTYILKRFFGAKTLKHKVSCSKCHSTSLRIDLAKGIIKCMNCHNFKKLPELTCPEVFNAQYENGMPIFKYRLTEDLWWYLYRNNKTYRDGLVEISAFMEDNDKQRYLINNTNVKTRGSYTLEELKKGEDQWEKPMQGLTDC